MNNLDKNIQLDQCLPLCKRIFDCIFLNKSLSFMVLLWSVLI